MAVIIFSHQKVKQDLIGRWVMLLPGKKDTDVLAAFLNEGIPPDAIERLDHTYRN